MKIGKREINFSKPLFFILSVFLIAYFTPRETDVSYDETEGKPWRYGLVTAPFDFPIYKDQARLDFEKDSIMSDYVPYYSIDDERSNSAIQTFLVDAEKKGYSKVYITYVVDKMKEIYSKGIISLINFDKKEVNDSDKLYLVDKDNYAKKQNISNFYTSKSAYELILKDLPHNLNPQILQSLNINDYLYDNIVYNRDLSTKSKDDLLSKIPFAEGNVLSGQKIIDRGEIVTGQTIHILNSLQKVTEQNDASKTKKSLMLLGKTIMIASFIFSFMAYLVFFRPREYNNNRNVIFMLLMIVLFSIATGVFVRIGFNVYIIPFTIATIMVRTFIDSRTAMTTHLVTAFICSLMVPYPLEFLMLQIPVGFTCIFSLRDLSERSQLIRSSFFIFISYVVSYIGISLATKGDFGQVEPLMFLYFAINFVFVMFVYLLVYMCEKVFGFISGVSMVELSNTNKPLLQKLSEVAPGTFQHSMQVSNLAAAVATHIGANASLVRTGALYHDIGKMSNPAYFTENQMPGMNPHDSLTYKESAQIIINHVAEGLRLAKKNNLPLQIKDFIVTHHGKGVVRYFYNSYCNEHPDEDVDIADFSYPGPNPFSKETAILMMADTVEAASRSLKEYTDESISNLVDKLIDSQMHEGLLRNAPITFKDIEIAKMIFKEKLTTIYHSRIVYPELKEPHKAETKLDEETEAEVG